MNNIIIMKYGVHASEEISSIINRKIAEIKDIGLSYWGYGGTFCHPLNQVQPFATQSVKQKEPIYLLMVRTISELNNTPTKGTMYSIDNINWNQIPKELNVMGSRYALVLKNLEECSFNINLSEYEVAVGNSKGKSLEQYIRYRVDKACAIKKENYEISNHKVTALHVTLIAELVEPYAIFIK